MNNLISFDGFDGKVRKTEDGRYSVFDVIQFCGKKNPRATWDRLCETYEEVVAKADSFKFPGRGQQGTPVANRENILYLLGLLPGAIGRAYREEAARVFLEYLDADPKLAVRIYEKASVVDRKWIKARQDGIDKRNSLTDTLQSHGVAGYQFAKCTDSLYTGLFNSTAVELREQRGLKPRSNVRDKMDSVELAAVALAEALADKKIDSENVFGFVPCRDACGDAGKKVRRVFEPTPLKEVHSND